ncbi:MAG: hypothetical protein SFU98_18365 [Leptospiraceae bacterium]|nr:hypothetical protein [Leptospiraceae bacterium]
MFGINKILSGIIFLLLASFPLSALDTIDLSTCNPNCVIGKNLEIYEDKTAILTIDDILQMDDSN